MIVLDAIFIGNINECFFTTEICNELKSSYSQLFSQPLGRKVQLLKIQMACAALMSATAILYMLYFISTSMAVRQSNRRVLIEQHHLPAHFTQQNGRYSPISQPWKPQAVPANYESKLFECPHCGTWIKSTQKT